jgi:hypothetical protein
MPLPKGPLAVAALSAVLCALGLVLPMASFAGAAGPVTLTGDVTPFHERACVTLGAGHPKCETHKIPGHMSLSKSGRKFIAGDLHTYAIQGTGIIALVLSAVSAVACAAGRRAITTSVVLAVCTLLSCVLMHKMVGELMATRPTAAEVAVRWSVGPALVVLACAFLAQLAGVAMAVSARHGAAGAAQRAADAKNAETPLIQR